MSYQRFCLPFRRSAGYCWFHTLYYLCNNWSLLSVDSYPWSCTWQNQFTVTLKIGGNIIKEISKDPLYCQWFFFSFFTPSQWPLKLLEDCFFTWQVPMYWCHLSKSIFYWAWKFYTKKKIMLTFFLHIPVHFKLLILKVEFRSRCFLIVTDAKET